MHPQLAGGLFTGQISADVVSPPHFQTGTITRFSWRRLQPKELILDAEVLIMACNLLAVTKNDATLQDREPGALEGHSETAFDLTPVAALEQPLAAGTSGFSIQVLAKNLLSKFGTFSDILATRDQQWLGFTSALPASGGFLGLSNAHLRKKSLK